MNTASAAAPRAVLSALWIVVLMQILFRDIHEFLSPGFIDEVRSGALNGTPLTPAVFLLGGSLLQVPIWMIALCYVLPDASLRRVNLIAAPLVMGLAFLAWPGDPDDWLHIGAEIAALIGVAGLCIRRPWAIAG